MRSSGLPRSKALHGQTRIIRARATDVTVWRQAETVGVLDEVTTTETEHTEQIWLFEPRESIAEELSGERIEGGLGGLIVSDGTVDVEHGDRVRYGGVEYEVDTIVGHPTDVDVTGGSIAWEDGYWGSEFLWNQNDDIFSDVSFWILSFERRQ